jgi:hypothetical protein
VWVAMIRQNSVVSYHIFDMLWPKAVSGTSNFLPLEISLYLISLPKECEQHNFFIMQCHHIKCCRRWVTQLKFIMLRQSQYNKWWQTVSVNHLSAWLSPDSYCSHDAQLVSDCGHFCFQGASPRHVFTTNRMWWVTLELCLLYDKVTLWAIGCEWHHSFTTRQSNPMRNSM